MRPPCSESRLCRLGHSLRLLVPDRLTLSMFSSLTGPLLPPFGWRPFVTTPAFGLTPNSCTIRRRWLSILPIQAWERKFSYRYVLISRCLHFFVSSTAVLCRFVVCHIAGCGHCYAGQRSPYPRRHGWTRNQQGFTSSCQRWSTRRACNAILHSLWFGI